LRRVPAILNPYLAFDGNAKEAMEFYRDIFGGELNVIPFAQFPGQEGPAPEGTMHAHLETPEGFVLMASDMPPGMAIERGNNLSVSLSGEDDSQLRGWWDKLSEGGQVPMPLERQMWGDIFGMCVDRFGTAWMVNINQPQG
jgi:PhnB protein